MYEYRNLDRFWHDLHKPKIWMSVVIVTMQQAIFKLADTNETWLWHESRGAPVQVMGAYVGVGL